MSGLVIGYKWLLIRDGAPVSPMYRLARWEGGHLEADVPPSLENQNGIYAVKEPDDPDLRNYDWGGERILVQLCLWGAVVEHERGYRAQHAEIMGVLRHEYETWGDVKHDYWEA